MKRGRRDGAVLRHHRVRASSVAPTSAPASGTSWPAAPSEGKRPREVVDHSIGPVWEANHVWLIFVLVVLWTAFSEAFGSIMLTLFVPLESRGARHRVARLELRVPQGGVPHVVAAQLRRRVRRLVGDRAVLHGRGRRGDRVRAGTGRRGGRRHLGQLDQPDVDPGRRARRLGLRVPRRGLHGQRRRPLRRPGDGRVLPPTRDRSGDRHRCRRVRRHLRPARRRRVRLRRADVPRAATRDHLGDLRCRLPRAARPQDARASPATWRSAPWHRSWWRGVSPSGRTCCPSR